MIPPAHIILANKHKKAWTTWKCLGEHTVGNATFSCMHHTRPLTCPADIWGQLQTMNIASSKCPNEDGRYVAGPSATKKRARRVVDPNDAQTYKQPFCGKGCGLEPDNPRYASGVLKNWWNATCGNCSKSDDFKKCVSYYCQQQGYTGQARGNFCQKGQQNKLNCDCGIWNGLKFVGRGDHRPSESVRECKRARQSERTDRQNDGGMGRASRPRRSDSTIGDDTQHRQPRIAPQPYWYAYSSPYPQIYAYPPGLISPSVPANEEYEYSLPYDYAELLQ